METSSVGPLEHKSGVGRGPMAPADCQSANPGKRVEVDDEDDDDDNGVATCSPTRQTHPASIQCIFCWPGLTAKKDQSDG